jgi:S1-C subfamily serine protease
LNLLDLVIVVLVVSAAVGGFRLGFVARALSWAGMAVGLAITARFLPNIIDAFNGPDATGRLLVAVGVLLGGAFVGQALGLVLGSKVHLAIPPEGRPVDSGAGAVAGILGVLVAVWVLVPAMADVPGTFARQARNSTIARAINEHAPPAPDALQALRRLVGDTQFPRVFDALRPAPDTGPPPADAGLSAATLAASEASTLKIEGPACGRLQEGSGFVVAPGVIVTNAHVVAGESRTYVYDRPGHRVPAAVVHFDPDRDLAVLQANVANPALRIGSAALQSKGAVLGYPGGGPLTVSPFQVRDKVTAVGRDLYDKHETRRQVLILASNLAPGDSGAALVDPNGTVVGVAFAIAPDRPGTSYALDTAELNAALAAPRQANTSTGGCLS